MTLLTLKVCRSTTQGNQRHPLFSNPYSLLDSLRFYHEILYKSTIMRRQEGKKVEKCCRDFLPVLIIVFHVIGLNNIRLMYSRSPNKIWKSEKTVNKIKCEKIH